MPVVYICRSCSNVLYVFESVGQDFYGPRSYRQVAEMFNWRCPYCGHRLGFPEVEVRPRGTSTGTALVQIPQQTYTSANVPKGLASRLKAYTEERGLTVSDVVRMALEEYLKARGWL